jgi:hypothetical protein
MATLTQAGVLDRLGRERVHWSAEQAIHAAHLEQGTNGLAALANPPEASVNRNGAHTKASARA